MSSIRWTDQFPFWVKNEGSGAAGGLAVFGKGGTDTVNNYGTISGNIELTLYKSDTNTINNLAGGVLNSGELITLRAKPYSNPFELPQPDPPAPSYLTNAGILSPGNAGTVQATMLHGDFKQTTTGTLTIDADWPTAMSDTLSVVGTAELDGAVTVNPLGFPAANFANKGLTKTFTILTATGGVTDNGITVADTAAVDYTLLFPDANTVTLQADINFVPLYDPGTPGLTGNQRQIGYALNALIAADHSLAFMTPMLTLSSAKALGDALNQLSPLLESGTVASVLATGGTFAQQLLSCRVNGEADDAERFIREGQCLWARANVRRSDIADGASHVEQDDTATLFSAGAQFDLGGPWRIGAGLGFERSELRMSNGASSETDRLHVGGVLKYTSGSWLFAATVAGGHGWADIERTVSIGTFGATASADADTNFVSGRLTGAYLFNLGSIYVKPQVELAVTRLSRGGYAEKGTGDIALAIEGTSETLFSASPSVEFGTEQMLTNGGVVRPYIRAGLSWFDKDAFATTASFVSAPADLPSFAITTSIDDVVADLAAGLDFIDQSGLTLRIQYDGRFGTTTEQHGGTAKISVPF